MSYAPSSFLVGEVRAYAGSASPSGWLICDGSAISRTVYAELFTTLGTTYGVGDGSTTFNLPDCKGRSIAGKETAATRLTTGGSGINGGILGAVGGAETLVAHSHGVGTLATSAHSITDTGHQHGTRLASTTQGTATTVGVGANTETATTTTGLNTAATTGISIGAHTISGSTASTGTGATHGNIPPTIILNYIIKF